MCNEEKILFEKRKNHKHRNACLIVDRVYDSSRGVGTPFGSCDKAPVCDREILPNENRRPKISAPGFAAMLFVMGLLTDDRRSSVIFLSTDWQMLKQ